MSDQAQVMALLAVYRAAGALMDYGLNNPPEPEQHYRDALRRALVAAHPVVVEWMSGSVTEGDR